MGAGEGVTTVLDEAKRVVYGERAANYGHPTADFWRSAKMWSVILGTTVTAEQVALCMIALKISRECNRPKRDNIVDIAGYAACIERLGVLGDPLSGGADNTLCSGQRAANK